MALFEEYTSEALIEQALEDAPEDIDIRQGSVFFDAISAAMIRIHQLFIDANIISEQSSVRSATGENLDILASNLYMSQLKRESAQAAQYSIIFKASTGIPLEEVDLEEGDRFIVEGLYFVLKIDDNGAFYIEAEEAGADCNNIPIGTSAVPVETIDDLAEATLGKIIRNGIDEEDDDAFRLRIQEMLSAPAENANAQQYKTWCENIKGVGTATIFPLFAGPNTVKAVLTDSNNQPCSAETVKMVQDYIDPITRNTTVTVDNTEIVVGDGIGEGVAPIGAHFLAVTAINCDITVSISNPLFTEGFDEIEVRTNIRKNIEAYFSSLTKSYDAKKNITVKIIQISAIIASSNGIEDFDNVLINNNQSNYIVPAGEIPNLKEIVFNE